MLTPDCRYAVPGVENPAMIDHFLAYQSVVPILDIQLQNLWLQSDQQYLESLTSLASQDVAFFQRLFWGVFFFLHLSLMRIIFLHRHLLSFLRSWHKARQTASEILQHV